MAHALQAPFELVDYLEHEATSDRRHELVAGRIHAMTGASMRHNRIAGNLYGKLLLRLAGGPCQAFISDMKLHVQAADSVYYPDVFVWCGSPTAGAALTANDATFIAEVLSPSTVEIDRREKLAAYMRLRSLRAYAVVSQDQHRVELHLRGDDGRWALAVLTEAEDLLSTPGLPGPGVRLAELYAGTDVAF